MARLNIRWQTRSNVAPAAAATGDAEANKEAAKRIADKPMLVYVTSDDNTDSTTRKLEDVCFADERISIGAKFFDCIKVTAGNALQDRLLKENGDETPRILLVSRDYEVQDVLEPNSLSSGKIVRAMSRAVRTDYKDSFDRLVSKYAKLLNELDRLDDKRVLIQNKIERAEGDEYKLKKIERDQKEHEKEMAKWKEKEEKLLAFRLREPAKPKS